MTTAEVGKQIRRSSRHVRALCHTGLLRGVKLVAPGANGVTQQSRLLIVASSVAEYLGVAVVTPSCDQAFERQADLEWAAAEAILGKTLQPSCAHPGLERRSGPC